MKITESSRKKKMMNIVLFQGGVTNKSEFTLTERNYSVFESTFEDFSKASILLTKIKFHVF